MTNLTNQNLLIQVINLARRPDRLSLITAELQKAGLNFEKQNAVDGQLESLESEFISKGAIGCWKSHINSMRRIVEYKAPFGLILEDDAILGPEVNDQFLTGLMELMQRNQLDILQIGFVEWLYSISWKSLSPGVLEFLIDLLKRRGLKDASGIRFVPGEFRSSTHAYIVNARLAKAIAETFPTPPLIPWDDYLGMLAKSQMHRGIRIARLVKSVVSQASYRIEGLGSDSDVYPK